MIHIGARNMYLYLPPDEPEMLEMGGEYEPTLKRWRFPVEKKRIIREYIEKNYPDFYNEDLSAEEEDSEEDSEDEGNELGPSPPMDHRLHRAKSFSRYSDSEDSDDSDDSSYRRSRSRSRSQKFKDCPRYREKLTNRQFSKKRDIIKAKSQQQ